MSKIFLSQNRRDLLVHMSPKSIMPQMDEIDCYLNDLYAINFYLTD